MSLATLVSRVTGFARDAVIAYAVGTQLLSSSYFVSNNIPNMIYELVAGGVLSSVFIPMFIERKENADEEGAWRFASSVLNIAILSLGAVALLGTVFAEAFVRTQTVNVAPDEAARFIALGSFFFRFFAIQVMFYGVHAVMTGILNSHRKFLAAAAAPIFNNLTMIAVVLFAFLPLRDSNPTLARTLLALGTTLAVLAMPLSMLPSLRGVKIRYSPRIDWRDPALRAMGRKMVATAVYVATNLVAVSLRNAYSLRTDVGEAGPAAIRYAWMFYQLPYGVFAVALATAFLPELATAAGTKDTSGYKKHFMGGLSATALLMLPAAALLIALAEPLVTLLRSGRFTASDVPVVAGVLRFWALGLFSFAAYMFTLRAFYALQDTRTPTITNIPGTVVHVALYSLLTLGFAGWAGLGLPGIAAADAIFYTLHFIVLAAILRKRLGPMNARAFVSSVGKVLVASVVGGLAAWGASLGVAQLLGDGRFAFLGQLLAGGVIGIAVAIAGSALLRVPELEVGRSLLARAFGRFFPRNGGAS